MSGTLRNGPAALLLAALSVTWTPAASAAGSAEAPTKYTVPGDFDGDYRADLLFQTAKGNLVVVLMAGTKPAASGVTTPRGMPEEGWRASGTADFDGDGLTDILWFHPDKGLAAIWHMYGVSRLYTTELKDRITDAVPVSIFDFDANGAADVLFQTTTGDLVVYLLDRGAVVAQVPLDLSSPGPDIPFAAVGAGDFDADGDADIVLHYSSPACPLVACNSTGNDAVAVALMDGSRGTITNMTELRDRNLRIGAVGDYDGDSHPDLVFYNTLTRETSAWLMDGLKIREAFIIAPDAPGDIVGPR